MLVFLLLVGAFHTITMPRFFYPGDNFTPRAEAANWMMTGQLGLPYEFKQQNPLMFRERGQYLFENDARQRLYPKYGIAYTLLYIPVLEAERLWTGKIEWMPTTQSLLVFLNIYNVLFTVVIALYLYLLVGLYAKSWWPRIGFILALFYATYVWYYLRAPTMEVFQIAAFVAFSYHGLRFLRESADQRSGRPKGAHLAAAVSSVGALVLMRPFFALLFPILGVFALVPLLPAHLSPLEIRRNAAKNARLYLACLALPAAVMIGFWLGVNHYRFGSVFNLGYSQWVDAQGQPKDRWGPAYFLTGLAAFLWRPGNGNIFIHNPLFLFALAGWPRFIKKYRVEGSFLLVNLAAMFLTLCFFSNSVGEWCYGPRYLVHPLIIGSIPILELWSLVAGAQAVIVRWGGRALIAVVLLGSLALQISMNSLHYFTYYGLRSIFDGFRIPEVSAYFDNPFSRAVIAKDLIGYASGHASFLPIRVLESRLPPQQSEVLAQVRSLLRDLATPNYLFFGGSSHP